MAFSQKLFDAIVTGKPSLAQSIVEEELADGADPLRLVSETMIPAMDEVGILFRDEEFFVPELMLAGRAMKAAMEPLRPLLAAAGAEPLGVIVAATVKGDLHDIGKNLVVSMLEGSGFKVHDLGTDVTPQTFVEAIREHRPQILCLSALLTVTMTAMKTTIDAIKEAGLRRSVKVLVGGAPLNERYATEIGADGYGATATDAVALARRQVGLANSTHLPLREKVTDEVGQMRGRRQARSTERLAGWTPHTQPRPRRGEGPRKRGESMLMTAQKKIGPRRKRVLDAINHRQPDRVPMDFGGSAVTGMHVSCVAKLRDHYGLQKRLVKVCEPYQMLGLIEDDLN